MKTFISCIVIILFISNISLVLAAPATNLKLTYSLDTHMLQVEADHPTDKPDKNFLRRVSIVNNQQEPQDFYFSRQKSPSKFKEDINFQAEVGDHLEVQVYSSEGGVVSGSLDITKPEEEK